MIPSSRPGPAPSSRDTRPPAGRRVSLLLGIALLATCATAGAQGMDVAGCGSLLNAFGPYDYTNPEDVRLHLPIVEQFHFDRGVEALRGHAQSGPQNLGGDLAYTLRAFPNHHRALDTMGRYQLREKQAPAPGARLTAECYFERAMAFAPDDGVVHMIYGIYLTRKGDQEGALARYLEALEIMPDSSELHYNLGLLYANLGRYDEALAQAQQAYAGGYPLPGLKNKLLRAGAWRDPPPAPEAAPPEAAPEVGSDPALTPVAPEASITGQDVPAAAAQDTTAPEQAAEEQ